MLPKDILIEICKEFTLFQLLELEPVCRSWRDIIRKHPWQYLVRIRSSMLEEYTEGGSAIENVFKHRFVRFACELTNVKEMNVFIDLIKTRYVLDMQAQTYINMKVCAAATIIIKLLGLVGSLELSSTNSSKISITGGKCKRNIISHTFVIGRNSLQENDYKALSSVKDITIEYANGNWLKHLTGVVSLKLPYYNDATDLSMLNYCTKLDMGTHLLYEKYQLLLPPNLKWLRINGKLKISHCKLLANCEYIDTYEVDTEGLQYLKACRTLKIGKGKNISAFDLATMNLQCLDIDGAEFDADRMSLIVGIPELHLRACILDLDYISLFSYRRQLSLTCARSFGDEKLRDHHLEWLTDIKYLNINYNYMITDAGAKYLTNCESLAIRGTEITNMGTLYLKCHEFWPSGNISKRRLRNMREAGVVIHYE